MKFPDLPYMGIATVVYAFLSMVLFTLDKDPFPSFDGIVDINQSIFQLPHCVDLPIYHFSVNLLES